MSAHGPAEWNLLFATGLIVAAQAAAFKRFFWDTPLKNGRGFFLGVAVPPGFYGGEGVGWLRRYHALIIAVNLILSFALAAVLVSGHWLLLPLWAGGVAIFHTSTLFGFRAYARAKLGANPRVESRVAISLEPRRLADYLWLPGEAIMAGVVVVSWMMLLANGDARVDWLVPLLLTYIAIGVLPLEVGYIRASLPPLPTDRPEEHRRWMDEGRRFGVRNFSLFRWIAVTTLVGYALLHGWRLVTANAWSRWALSGVVLAVWLVQVMSLLLGERRLAEMGRGLHPAGSWSTPFREAKLMPRGWMTWFWVWFGGLVLLVVVAVR